MVLTGVNIGELFLEGFKGGGKGKGGGAADGTGAADGAGGAGGAANSNGVLTAGTAGAVGGALLSGGSAASMSMSNVGSNNVEKCPLTDETLYCQVSRTAGIAGMVVYILIIIGLVIGVLYAIYYLFFRSGGSGVISKVARKGR
jgi:hypothetical protein